MFLLKNGSPQSGLIQHFLMVSLCPLLLLETLPSVYFFVFVCFCVISLSDALERVFLLTIRHSLLCAGTNTFDYKDNT